MTILSIDIETYSPVDLKKAGLYAYAEHPETEILLLAYAYDDSPVEIVDLATGKPGLPLGLIDHLCHPDIIKTAWNAAFEIALLSRYYQLHTEQWRCSMVQAYYLGLPGSLSAAARALKLDQQKDFRGTQLINYFSRPNAAGKRNFGENALAKWQQFKDYCKQDVETERAARKCMEHIPLPDQEQRLWVLDQKINRHGVLIDTELVDHAIECHTKHQDKLLAEAEQLTGLDNPNSVSQLKTWLSDAANLEVESLNKDAIPDLLKQTDCAKVQRVLELRQELAKTSVKKYTAMQQAKCSDNRVRGLLQFYGANRTGRFSSRLVQIHNLPRNSLRDLDLARTMLKEGQYDAIELLWGSIPDTLSQLIRTALIPAPGKRFIVSDFSAIEARVLAWLAGETWVLEVFRGDGKIYEATAAQMFRVPIESVTKGSDLRQKGKVATLACGYQGGPGALIKMGALDQGLKEDDLPGIVSAWRKANPHIVQFWQAAADAAMAAVQDQQTTSINHGLSFSLDSSSLRIQLPSGRSLYYVRPRIELDPRYGRYGITYEDNNRRTRTYGGKLVENITQAVARDCLTEALLQADCAGYDIAFHVHDELILEVPETVGSLADVDAMMSQPIAWAPGLPLAASSFECLYYQKD